MAEQTPSDPHAQALAPLRLQIDELDRQIVELLNKRAGVVVQIGKVKQQNKTPIYQPDREKDVLEKVRKLNQGPLSNRCLEAVYRELISGSIALEKPLRIGFLGPEGTFSHAAAAMRFGSSVEYVPLSAITAVFEEVVRGHVDYGLVPVENSIGGGVVDTLDAFLHSSAKICAEVLITVHHNLLANQPWEKITKICSKAQVFSQCREWLSATAKDRAQVDVESTTHAAQMALNETGVAAIASKHAATLYGLDVLFANIEDNPDKTAIMFTTAHKPGALAEVLDVFKENGINLTDIEKRPSKKVNWEYYFFIDAQGHQDDAAMKTAIEQAKKHCLQLTVLGSYPRAAEVL
jgi:chorismate mutase/prephenate dehydratase